MHLLQVKIVGSGSHIPAMRVPNEAFLAHEFFDKNSVRIPKTNVAITQKFEEVAGITERRCAIPEHNTSDLGYLAAKRAIESSGIDPETLDYIIVAHNFGDILPNGLHTDMLPNLAAKVKQKLGVKNSRCVAYDILFGCPSWLQALIQANYFLKSGDVKRILVVGADTVSRAVDPHDIDGMLFADGAGAVILEAEETNEKVGVLSHLTISDCITEADHLRMAHSNNKDTEGLHIDMNGKGVFRYAVQQVPKAIKQSLDKCGLTVDDVDKFVIHQANMKMNKIILSHLYNMYDYPDYPEEIMPLVVDVLGNSSAATIPTLWDMIVKGDLPNQNIQKGDVVVFASVGAGMHANCVVYKHW